MSVLSVKNPYPIFTDLDGDPLENGYIWIGTANLDPQTNPIAVFWDAALTMPAVQPIRTLAGFPANSGSPGKLFVDSDYSILVKNKKGLFVYSATNVNEFISSDFISYLGPGGIDYTLSGLLTLTALDGNNYLIKDISDDTDVLKGDALMPVLQPITGAVPRTQHDKNTDNITIIDVGASNIPGAITPANNNTYIQSMLDDYDYVKFVPGIYEVTELFFRRTDQVIDAKGAIFIGKATVATDAVIHIVNPNITIWGLVISADYNVNYSCALKWHDLLAGDSTYPGRCKINGLHLANAVIGIMYGDSVAPVDAPVSENFITGFSTRGVIRPIYTNQPNGFLNIVNGLFDCQKYEWDTNSPGTYNDLVACCIENVECELLISNSEFIKASSTLGFGIINYAKLLINNCSSEIAATNFLTNFGGVTLVNGFTNNFFSNSSTSFIACGNDTSTLGRTNVFIGNSIYASRNPALVGTAIGIMNTTNSDNSLVSLNNCVFQNFTLGAMLSSDYGFWSAANVRFSNTRIDNGTTYTNLDNNSKNIASAYTILDIANFGVTAGAGTSAVIATAVPAHPDFVNALKITGASGVSCLAQMNVAIPLSSGNSVIVEVTMQAAATAPETFYGSMVALFVDDAAGLVGSTDMSNGAGSIAHLATVSGNQAWKTVRFALQVPAKSAYFLLRFGVDSNAQEFWIGNIKVF
jgi:hypothetical protein